MTILLNVKTVSVQLRGASPGDVFGDDHRPSALLSKQHPFEGFPRGHLNGFDCGSWELLGKRFVQIGVTCLGETGFD